MKEYLHNCLNVAVDKKGFCYAERFYREQYAPYSINGMDVLKLASMLFEPMTPYQINSKSPKKPKFKKGKDANAFGGKIERSFEVYVDGILNRKCKVRNGKVEIEIENPMRKWQEVRIYLEKLKIWGEQIPYNTGRSKLEDMTIRKRPFPVAGFCWFRDIFGEYVTKDMGRLDTFSYLDEIRSGKTSRFYDDVPTLVPFLVKGSKKAVIVAPGGGFCNLSRKREGYDMARFLNENGISAFVLEYRLNPYKAPVCYLDMQRAIRYVRHHAAEYGISRKQIGTMGFSAGGYVTGASYILLGNAPVEYKGYRPDEVDGEDGIDRYGAKLEELKVPHQTVCIDGAGHGFALNNKKYFFWAKEYIRWIQNVVK